LRIKKEENQQGVSKIKLRKLQYNCHTRKSDINKT